MSAHRLTGAPAWSWAREQEARAARVHEDAVAARLAVIWGCDFTRYADNSPVDWYCSRWNKFTRKSDQIGLAEVKCRKIQFGQYPTIWLSQRKYHWLRVLSFDHKRPAVFVAGCLDAIAWIELGEIKRYASHIVIRGRYDRGLRNDVEPMLDIPVVAFHVVRPLTVVGGEEPEPI
jgi:hypothetical protein